MSGDAFDELDDKIKQVRERIEQQAAKFRQIQPQDERTLADDQATLTNGGDGS